MIPIPSKYEVGHYVSLHKWIAHRMGAMWMWLPGLLVQPCRTDRGFGFVCGCGHSGTTLLAAKLGQHRDCFLIGRETDAFCPTLGLRCSKRIVMEWDFFASSAGKKLILEKTPKHIHAIKRIHHVLPDAKIVILVRNPLDNVASLYRRLNGVKAATKRWLTDNKVAAAICGNERVMVLRYEDLTARPDDEFARVCRFVGLTWDPEILRAGETQYDSVKHRDDHMNLRARQVRGAIWANVGGWRDVLSRDQAEYVKNATRSLAGKLGYTVEMDSDMGPSRPVD